MGDLSGSGNLVWIWQRCRSFQSFQNGSRSILGVIVRLQAVSEKKGGHLGVADVLRFVTYLYM